jgi:hypothetical protein
MPNDHSCDLAAPNGIFRVENRDYLNDFNELGPGFHFCRIAYPHHEKRVLVFNQSIAIDQHFYALLNQSDDNCHRILAEEIDEMVSRIESIDVVIENNPIELFRFAEWDIDAEHHFWYRRYKDRYIAEKKLH